MTLPSNPNTISDQRPQANLWTAETVHAAYQFAFLDAATASRAESDLEELRRWDLYERRTCPNREGAKAVLLSVIAQCRRQGVSE